MVASIRAYLLLVALTAILFFAAFNYGGVSHTDQNFYLAVLGFFALVAALWPSMPANARQPRLQFAYRICLPLLPAWALLQIIPLPASWVVALSPARAEALRGLSGLGIDSPKATLSVSPLVTRDYLLLICAYIIVFLLIRQLAAVWTADRSWILVVPLLLLAASEAILGFAQHSLGSVSEPIRGTYANRNHFAGLMELTLPFAIAWPLAWLRRPWRHREETMSITDAVRTAACWILAAVCLVAVIFSQSRMGFIGALFSLFVVGALAFATRARVLPSRRTVWLSIAGVGFATLLTFIFLPTNELLRRYAQAVIEVSETEEPETRLQDWRETIPLIRSYPLFGCGFGGFSLAFPKFKTVTPMLTANHAHNDYLEITAEAGLPGAAIFLLLLGVTLQTSLHRAFTTKRRSAWALSLASNGALAAILLHSTVDFNLYIPANAMIVSWIAALAASGTKT